MSCPLRLEFPDALYDVTARGDRRGNIFEDDQDRHAFPATQALVVKQFNWLCYAYCLVHKSWGQV
jgi:putative transposase